MKKSAFISDVIFTFFLSALATLFLFRYLNIPLFTAVILSTVCGILCALSFGAYAQSKRKSFFLKRSDEAQKQKLLTHLSLLSDEKKTQFFKSVLSTSEQSAKRVAPLKINVLDELYYLNFHFSPVQADEIAKISRQKTRLHKIVLCDRIEESAVELAGALGIKYKTAESVYLLVKEKNALPQEFLGDERPLDKKKKRLRLCFAKSNAKRFLVCGTLVLLTSFLSPFPYYYFLFGFALLVVALLVRIFGYR